MSQGSGHLLVQLTYAFWPCLYLMSGDNDNKDNDDGDDNDDNDDDG